MLTLLKLNYEKKHLYLFLILIIIIAITGFIYYFKNKTNIIDKELKEIYSLPKTYTLDQAINDGIVNVTGVCMEKSKKIDDFLLKATQKQWAILKTIELNNEDLIIKVYVYDDRINEIRLWKYLIKRQAALSPDKRFKTDYTIKNENGVSKIYLINIKNTEYPNHESQVLEDEILYSFAEKNNQKE